MVRRRFSIAGFVRIEQRIVWAGLDKLVIYHSWAAILDSNVLPSGSSLDHTCWEPDAEVFCGAWGMHLR
jgi:hypothetical protein